MPSHYNSLIFLKPSRFGYNQRRKDLTRPSFDAIMHLGHAYTLVHNGNREGSQGCLHKVNVPSRELTYPTWGKGKSSSKCHLGDMLVPWGYVSSLEGIDHVLTVEPKIFGTSQVCQVIHVESINFFQCTRQQQLPCVELHHDTSCRPQIRPFIPTSVLVIGQDEDFNFTPP